MNAQTNEWLIKQKQLRQNKRRKQQMNDGENEWRILMRNAQSKWLHDEQMSRLMKWMNKQHEYAPIQEMSRDNLLENK